MSDEDFALAVNQMGAASMEQIEAARAAQAASAQKGLPASLADMLVQQGIIPPALRDNVEKKLLAQQGGGIKQLGNYKLLRKLGEGGMGAVYLAEDTLVQRKVALKVLGKRYAGDAAFLKRFRREAQATGKLNHVNIVSAYTVGEDFGHHYYAMEYCEGETLSATLMRQHFLPWDRALEIVAQVARGLQHAHEHGFIHRDIKPANIIIAADGVAKILDLGLSKSIVDGEQSFATQTGVALGTPHYLAPEQARGDKHLDGRADIYSLGATLYHLVTGQTPFEGDTGAAIMLK
ncbi:MAG: serine/threonine-protein kinase, partial [Planctomycetota bacterium]|nr:serine/threonine-protein kinase [Planctomycetota bacterium]